MCARPCSACKMYIKRAKRLNLCKTSQNDYAKKNYTFCKEILEKNPYICALFCLMAVKKMRLT